MNKCTREIMSLLKENFKRAAGEKKFQDGSEERAYYLFALADNLREAMEEKALLAYGNGSGNEIFSGKMNALRSSSALTYNLFGNTPAKIIKTADDSKISTGTYSVEFEKQYHTLKPSVPGKPANLDAFLYCEETFEAIACEMKMMEWLCNSPGKLREKYLERESYITPECADYFIPAARELMALYTYDEEPPKEYPCKFSKYDAFQMFKHALACYSACMGEEKRKIEKLTLVNCVWTLPTPEKLSAECCKAYKEAEETEHREFDEFKAVMEPIGKLFSKCGVEFNIEFLKFSDFLSNFEKSDKELDYLKRYTFR